MKKIAPLLPAGCRASLGISFAVLFCASLQPCSADLFLINSNGAISEYTNSGRKVSSRVNPLDGGYFSELAATGTQLFVLDSYNGIIGKYSATDKMFNPTLITGLGGIGENFGVVGIAASGGSLYVLNDFPDAGTVSQYSASGTLVDPSLITGIGRDFDNGPRAIVASGDKLYVATRDGTIGEYATSGEIINRSLITGVEPGFSPIDLAVSDDGLRLFVSSYDSGTISEYTTSGQLVKSALISGLHRPSTLAVSGSRLFIGILTNPGGDDGFPAGHIAEYTTSGELVDPLFVRNQPPLDLAFARDVNNVPETLSTWCFAATTAGVLLIARSRSARC